MALPIELESVMVDTAAATTTATCCSNTPSSAEAAKPVDVAEAVAQAGVARASMAASIASMTRVSMARTSTASDAAATATATATANATAIGAAATGLERVPTYLQPNMPLRERLHHFTFAWYTVTMSTSGIALVLGITPHRFAGLNAIGLAIFLMDLLFFLFISLALCCRFALHRHTFRRAATHPHEALFISTFFLSIAAMLSSAGVYGRLYFAAASANRTGLFRFLHVAFWIYVAATFAYAVLQYHILFSVKPQRRLRIDGMTPAWILPIFPVMLAGTLAGVVSPDQTPARALAVLAAGLAAQGLGFLVSVFMYATYLSRLIVFGLPAQRPGMFIAVGPPSFTCAAFVAIAADAPRVLAHAPSTLTTALLDDVVDFATAPSTLTTLSSADLVALVATTRLIALAASVFLWGLSFWFFLSAAAAVLSGMPDRRFHLSWWSIVFPNAGLTIATIRIGTAFGSEGVLWLTSVMTVCLVLAWIFIAFRCVRAVIYREIVWPGHDEDKD